MKLRLMELRLKRSLSRGLGLVIALTSAAFATLSDPARAQLTTYTLTNVSFNVDGSGTVSGFFEYDPTLGIYGSFSLTTSDGGGALFPTFTGYTYDPTNSNAPLLGNGEFDFLSNDGSMVLDLSSSSPVALGGTYSLTKSEENDRSGGFGGSVNILNYRDGDNGTLTASPAAVPEASTTVSLGLLLALGLSSMVIAARRKKASTS